ncbi:hypothetical protein GGI25_004712 [Coemansia spiralis]|uniref:Uncharacterized protein n=2 Tax=Coemansia TaxID=4863 RepID=A0A9W8G3P5_9FUNG|nr:hypothetical protein EDC05_004483 [Coemansia umbellata]KAJ2621389.1 hypothetical protein GGI26_004171 [Coemansia sp. RSA 1358]KAJ2673450.1 hypothetical protein GGI25_004712 [Coemansia spiralis]
MAPATNDPAQPKSDASAEQSKQRQQLDGQIAGMQLMLHDLAAKTDAAERATAGAQDAKVADAYKDILRAEHAVESLESRLDALLGRLDSLLEQQQQQQPTPKEEK